MTLTRVTLLAYTCVSFVPIYNATIILGQKWLYTCVFLCIFLYDEKAFFSFDSTVPPLFASHKSRNLLFSLLKVLCVGYAYGALILRMRIGTAHQAAFTQYTRPAVVNSTFKSQLLVCSTKPVLFS
ncbi:hypothetical protein BY458DRAFT_490128 [Sporodiniella umbellata]|nr:hypothetical protein BY458DRAFT_490128 [Sporodiniella umbellata]